MMATGNIRYGALNEISAERNHQEDKWGDGHDDGHSDGEWLGLHQIRLGQVAEACFEGEQGFSGRPPNVPALREQLVKAAAVIVAHIEAIDRRSA